MSVEQLLNPTKVALVGANERDGFGGDTSRNLLEFGNPDNIYFINPKRDEVFGHPCYPSLSALPEDIDQVIIATRKETVNDILREASAKGATSAVVFASGYSETGKPEDKRDEDELIAVAKELQMSVMGPNCAGFVNLVDGITSYALKIPHEDRRGVVGLISQSGQTCLSAMESQNMRMSYNISAGNSADVKMEDYLMYLVDDPETRVIAMHLEGVQNPEKLTAAFKKAAEIGKPIVVLKIGKSKKGSVSAASHTGSLSGADQVIDAIFKKFGVIRVDDLQELFSVSMTLATWKHLPTLPTFGLMAISGGEVGISADVSELAGIDLPDFTEETTQRLNAILPGYATAHNPLDTTASVAYDVDAYAEAIKAILADPNIGALILGYTLPEEINDPAIYYMEPAIKKAIAESSVEKPIVMMPYMENTRNPEYQDKLLQDGVPILPPPKYALPALKKIVDFSMYQAGERTLAVAVPEGAQGNEQFTLNEKDSMNILHSYTVPVPMSTIVTSADEAIAAASRVDGPVALKIASEDIKHKTDVGGVQLNLQGADNVKLAYETIMRNVRMNAPEAHIDGMNVQEMVKPGMEAIVGVVNDPQFGPSVMVGLGGVFVEVFGDTSLYPAPLNKYEATKMIKDLKAWPLFTGHRGQKNLDVNALADTLVSISTMAADYKDRLVELDINPLFVYEEGQGVCAADALLILNEPGNA